MVFCCCSSRITWHGRKQHTSLESPAVRANDRAFPHSRYSRSLLYRITPCVCDVRERVLFWFPPLSPRSMMWLALLSTASIYAAEDLTRCAMMMRVVVVVVVVVGLLLLLLFLLLLAPLPDHT